MEYFHILTERKKQALFYPVQNFDVVREFKHLAQTVKEASCWQVLVYFRVFYCQNFLKIEQQNGITWQDMIDVSNLSMRQVPVSI